MTQEQILEYKRMCAEILGYKNKGMKNLEMWVSKKNPNGVNTNELQFDSDWDLIIKVVEDIEELGYIVLIGKNSCVIEQHFGKISLDDMGLVRTQTKPKTKKEAVIQSIYEFLLWYKNSK